MIPADHVRTVSKLTGRLPEVIRLGGPHYSAAGSTIRQWNATLTVAELATTQLAPEVTLRDVSADGTRFVATRSDEVWLWTTTTHALRRASLAADAVRFIAPNRLLVATPQKAHGRAFGSHHGLALLDTELEILSRITIEATEAAATIVPHPHDPGCHRGPRHGTGRQPDTPARGPQRSADLHPAPG
ncbi:MAG: hypothetical protein ACK5LS_04385 [Propioniciclava sp.]